MTRIDMARMVTGGKACLSVSFQQSCRAIGQGLQEYAVIAVITGLVLAGGMMIVANDFNGILQALRENLQGNAKAALLAREKPAAPAAGTDTSVTPPSRQEPAPVSALSPAMAGNLTVKLADGTLLNLNIPTDVSNTVLTVGANGTTDLLASSIEQLAQQLLAEGKIDQSQANALQNLANQGHKMAAMQKELEAHAAKYANDPQGFANTPVTMGGVTYPNAAAAAKVIGIDPANNAQGGEYAQFWNLYGAAKGANYTWPPELQSILEYQASSLAAVSNTLNNQVYGVGAYGASPADIAPNVASDLSNQKSADICTMDAGNSDTGVHCNG